MTVGVKELKDQTPQGVCYGLGSPNPGEAESSGILPTMARMSGPMDARKPSFMQKGDDWLPMELSLGHEEQAR